MKVLENFVPQKFPYAVSTGQDLWVHPDHLSRLLASRR